MTDDARAFWVAAPGRGEIRAEPLPPPVAGRRRGPRAVTAASAAAPRRSCSRAACRRASTSACARRFRPASFPAPVKYGYASVGIVERGPRDLRGPARVRALSASDALRRARRGRASCCRDDVPPAARRAGGQPRDGDQRPVGRAAAGRRSRHRHRRAARSAASSRGSPGASPAATSSSSTSTRSAQPSRGRSACAFAQPEARRRRRGRRDPRQRIAGGPRARAARSPAFEATIVEMSWYGDQAVPLPLGEAFHARRLTIKSSQVGRVAAVAARALGLHGAGCSSRWRCSPTRRSTC